MIITEKSLSTPRQDMDLARKIMKEAYEENPEWHPYGFSVDQATELNYIEDAKGERVGVYGYSIGEDGHPYAIVAVSPIHRGFGAGRAALRNLKTVIGDFKYLVHKDNKPSIALANSLELEVEYYEG
jgi:GNAT superfamily N-acetyltransferase